MTAPPTRKAPLDREAAINAALAILERDPGLAELIDQIADDDPHNLGADAIEGAIALALHEVREVHLLRGEEVVPTMDDIDAIRAALAGRCTPS